MLVEALLGGAQVQPAPVVHREVHVGGEVLVGAQVVHDALPLLAEHHGRVEAAPGVARVWPSSKVRTKVTVSRPQPST